MAVKHTYEYETVEAGGILEDGTTDASPNNTLLEIANAEDINVNTLIALNPHLLSTGIIKGGPNGTTLTLYYGVDGSKIVYTVPAKAYSEEYTISKIATQMSNEQMKIDPRGLINQNKEVLAEYCCFKAGQQVFTKYDEMTNSFEDFAINTIVVDQTGLTIKDVMDKLNKDSTTKYKLETLLSLNPNIGQTDILPINSVILCEVYSTGNGSTVKITGFGVQADTTRTLFVTWEWDNKENEVDNYRVKWEYQTSDGLWWIGSDGSTTDGDTKESMYGADEKAIAVRVTVKPVSGSGLLGSDEYEWSTAKYFYFNKDLQMLIPEISEVKIEKYYMTITAYVDVNTIKEDSELDDDEFTVETVINENIEVEFEIIQDDSVLYNTSNFVKVTTKTGKVSYSLVVEDGHKYHVRARSRRKEILYSSWTEYKGPYESAPSKPTEISIEAVSETQIKVTWKKINSAKSYNIEYVMKDDDVYTNINDEEYFATGDVKTVSPTVEYDITDNYNGYVSYNIANLTTGRVYLLRMRAVNESDLSVYSDIHSFVVGVEPDAPTTWSSTTTALVGEPLKLYWIHNSEDSSVESYAKLRLIVDDVQQEDILIRKSTDKKEKYEPSVYELNTNSYAEGSKIEWMVQTSGVLNNNGAYVYGKWSIKRTVNIYAPPTVSLGVIGSNDNNIGGEALPLRSFPFYLDLKAGNAENQKPTGYYINISAMESCTTIDNVGNTIYISPGTKVYSKYIDTDNIEHRETINASDVNLQNNMKYLISVVVSMSSGLSSETVSRPIKVAWNITESIPYAEIAVKKDTLTAQIMPYVSGGDTNVLLSVYRREFDGSFTEIHTNIQNGNNTVVIDPHPSLDYARYRIVARNQSTGVVTYNDIPAVAVNEKSIVIQWNEAWQSFNITNNGISDSSLNASYAGSMLKLPYNIDVSNVHSQDVTHVRYIGRKRPVSYYGTQLGETATWNTVIPKYDKETLYALRRLAVWMGDVYVREPSGSGYWASITVSFSQAHLDLTIPVTINITPVEGGS